MYPDISKKKNKLKLESESYDTLTHFQILLFLPSIVKLALCESLLLLLCVYGLRHLWIIFQL